LSAAGRDFARRLIDWQAQHGRHDLPWQDTRDAYRIWLSEIMLQQTQVETVVPYYRRFLDRFPDVASLAAAPLEDVLALWSGLGYYARARNLHRCAVEVATRHGGEFPREPARLAELPGIGRSTAAAIAAFAFGTRCAILDGNVKRVLCRAFGIAGFPGSAAVQVRLWALAECLLPDKDVARYIQAQMDLGATLCTRARPACVRCPLATSCVALRDGRVAELPAPKPARTVPRRAVRVAVLQREGAVLLERRPPSGIWGGLLALPEIPPEVGDTVLWARTRLGLEVRTGATQEGLTHRFTHFVLDMQPLLFEVQRTCAASEPGLQWQALEAIAGAALPTPVRRILERLRP
jgi:A/G-specific adenine glycosylase